MWEYALAFITIGFGYLAYHIKKNVFDFVENLVDSPSKFRKWVPSPEEENLDNSYQPVSSIKKGSDCLIFCGGDSHGNLISLGIERTSHNTAQVKACVWLQDGKKLETFEEAEELLPCTGWTCRGFSFQMVEPLDLWRIVINTMMKCDENTYVHVNMRFMWRASSSPIYLYQTSQEQLYYSIDERADSLRGHDQYGALSGTVSVDGVSCVLHYLSVKHRDWSSDRDVYVQSDHEQIFTLNFSKGSCIGHFNKCNKAYAVLKRSDVDYKSSKVQISIPMPDGSNKTYCLNNREANSGSIYVANNQFSFNFNSFMGGEFQSKSIPPLCQLDTAAVNHKLVVSLLDEEAMNSSVVGAKAANLAILKRLNDEEKNPIHISIPSGFCITAEAYRQHLVMNPLIANAISQLDSAPEDDLEFQCEKLQTLWLSSHVCSDLQQVLSSHLHKDTIYAVRSSGIEEDLDSSSAAGQNESVLGVSGQESVAHSILLCWTSLFSNQSVQYRRKNGLGVSSSEMCVLVQELVPEVLAAGVLFSCHPVTGNPWTSIVSCNYGLGLSVVGATCDPDTFTITFDIDRGYYVQHKKCGNKANKTVFVDQVIQDMPLSKEDNADFSIKDEQAIRLAKVGYRIRRIFGFECDIEWVLDSEDTIHIVQVRPVTSILNWTDYELAHEFDSAIHEGYDALTYHNIGEVCPGSICPMTMVMLKTFDRIFAESLKIFADGNMELNNMIMYSYHAAMDMFHALMLAEDDPVSQIIMCGQVVSTPEIHRLFLLRRKHHSLSTTFKAVFFLIVNAFRTDTITKKAITVAKNFTIPQSDDPVEMLNSIIEALSTYKRVSFYHCIVSSLSAIMQRILITSVVGNDVSKISSDALVKVANSIINSTNTVSVDITHQFKHIVASIISEDDESRFLSINPSDGMAWLRQHCVKSYEMLEKFFVKFGHRGYKEMHLDSETWSMNKPKVLEMLQTLVQAKNKEGNNKNGNNINGTEKAEGVLLNRSVELENSKILSLLLPYTRNVVARRELTKDMVALCIHKLRLSFIHLGSDMQRAGLIPHSRLIFCLTLYEVKLILSGRNAGIISKAIRREKLLPKLDKLMFDAQSIGRPIPLNRKPKLLSLGSKLSGTPVWPGELVGIARVILDLSGASSIAHGEILITHATDTGWTPYFSMIGGLVTELGGILSHGAVVAREYGLPCIVGVDDVTLYFKTGDKVLLNSTKGTVEKVVEEQES